MSAWLRTNRDSRTPKMSPEDADELWHRLVLIAVGENKLDEVRDPIADEAFGKIAEALDTLSNGEAVLMLEIFRLDLVAEAEEKLEGELNADGIPRDSKQHRPPDRV